MYAVIETGGKQYRVQNGDVLNVEKLGVEAGEKVVFDKVLVIGGEDETRVGTPYLEGETVEAEVLENGKGKKIVIFKYKNKKDYRKKQGHRQPYTMVEIKSIGGVAAPVKAEEPAAEAEAPAEAEAETNADAPKSEKKVSASMKKDELIAYAKEHGIEIDEKATKAVIIETIENAEA